MKLTFITDEATQSPDDFASLSAVFGIRAIELRSVYGKQATSLNWQEIRSLDRTLSVHQISICCLSTPIFKSDLDTNHDTEFADLTRAAKIARHFSIPGIRIFSFWRRPDRQAVRQKMMDLLMRAGELAERHDVRLWIENGKRTMHCTGYELAELLENLGTDQFGALWDPANSIMSGHDLQPLKVGYTYVRRHIRHIHLKDPSTFRGEGRYVPLGQGNLGIRSQIRILHTDGYDGYLSLETHWRPDRILSTDELDLPGGAGFSRTGYEATASSLQVLREVIQVQKKAATSENL